jgi:hypothetical protein
MPLYTFLHNLLNVLVQIANKTGLQKEILNCLSAKVSFKVCSQFPGILNQVLLRSLNVVAPLCVSKTKAEVVVLKQQTI